MPSSHWVFIVFVDWLVLVKGVVIVIHLGSSLGILLQRSLVILVSAPSVATLLSELHPFHFVNCFGWIVLLDWTVVVSDNGPLPALVISCLSLLGFPHV